MSAGTTMWGIVNIKKNACLCMLQRTVRKSAKEILALKGTEKYASMEKVVNIKLNVNSDIIKKDMKFLSMKFLDFKKLLMRF
jgi:hypothetical protein